MKTVMHTLEAARVHMRVNLRRRDVSMAQQFLDHPQIRAVPQKMGCERVPHQMGVNGTL